MGFAARKHVFGVSHKVRPSNRSPQLQILARKSKFACSKLRYGAFPKVALSQKQITKAPIRLGRCAVRSTSLLFASLRRQFFSRGRPYVKGGHIIWMCPNLSNTQVIRNYSLQSGVTAGTLILVVWHDPVLKAHLPSWGVVTNGWCA